MTQKELNQKLISACYMGDLESIKYLIEKGADVNTKDLGDDNLLQYALFKNNSKIAKFLIEMGADVNAKNGDGWTPLRYAIFSKNIEIVKLLVESGADVNAKAGSDDNRTVLDVAKYLEHQEIAEYLEGLTK